MSSFDLPAGAVVRIPKGTLTDRAESHKATPTRTEQLGIVLNVNGTSWQTPQGEKETTPVVCWEDVRGKIRWCALRDLDIVAYEPHRMRHETRRPARREFGRPGSTFLPRCTCGWKGSGAKTAAELARLKTQHLESLAAPAGDTPS